MVRIVLKYTAGFYGSLRLTVHEVDPAKPTHTLCGLLIRERWQGWVYVAVSPPLEVTCENCLRDTKKEEDKTK